MQDEHQGTDALIDGLIKLLDGDELSPKDRKIAQKCLRRLEQPLRLTVFGKDPKKALWLLNLMVGQTVVSPALTRARVQFVHSENPFAMLEFRDGSRKRLESDEFRSIFEENPTRVRIGVDLPVLKKVSFMVVAEGTTAALCSDADKTLWPADVAVWTGSSTDDRLNEVWEQCPDLLRDHSYLVLSPEDEESAWDPIRSEFIDVITVDARTALEAKNKPGGADTKTFREVGGAAVVKAVKKEIETLLRASTDTAEMILARYEEMSEDKATQEAVEALEDVALEEHSYRLRRQSRMTLPRVSSQTPEIRAPRPKTVGRRNSRLPAKATPWSLGL